MTAKLFFWWILTYPWFFLIRYYQIDCGSTEGVPREGQRNLQGVHGVAQGPAYSPGYQREGLLLPTLPFPMLVQVKLYNDGTADRVQNAASYLTSNLPS